MSKIKFIVFILMIVACLHCQSVDKISTLKNKEFLLFVEDVNNNGGYYDGDFSEIVIYDLDSNNLYQLTDDGWFDGKPQYLINTDKIIFESTRGGQKIGGLTNDLHLFEINIQNSKIQILDDNSFHKRYTNLVSNSLNTPQFSSNEKELFFLGYKPDRFNREYLFQYSIGIDSLQIVSQGLKNCFGYALDNTNSIIYYNNWVDSSRSNEIWLFNQHNEKVFSLYENDIFISDVQKDILLFVNAEFNNRSIQFVNLFDVNNNHIIKKINMTQFGFREVKNPVFKDLDNIYFIGDKAEIDNDSDEDVYLLNLRSKNLKQITFTSNIKQDLKYYKTK